MSQVCRVRACLLSSLLAYSVFDLQGLNLIKGEDGHDVGDLIRIRGGVYGQRAQVVNTNRHGGECVYIVLPAKERKETTVRESDTV